MSSKYNIRMTWIPCKDRLPDKTKEALKKCYLITATDVWSDGSNLHVYAIDWGPASDHAYTVEEDRDYIFDGWCFGQLWDDGIDVAEHAIAWTEFPEPYRE